MVKLIIYFVFLFLCGCQSLHLSERRIPMSDNIGYEMHFQLRSYYLKNLKYPSLDEFINYCWERTNANYENRYKDYMEYSDAMNGTIPILGPDSLMYFMENYRNNLTFNESNGELSILWNPTSSLIMKEKFSIRNYLNDDFYRKDFFVTYDEQGEIIVDSDLDNLLNLHLYENVWKTIQLTSNQQFVWCLISYNVNAGAKVLDTSDTKSLDTKFIDVLFAEMESFVKENDLSQIRIPIKVPVDINQ